MDGMAVFQAVKHHQEQIEEARRLHHQDLKASVSLHNHEIEVENKIAQAGGEACVQAA